MALFIKVFMIDRALYLFNLKFLFTLPGGAKGSGVFRFSINYIGIPCMIICENL